jgi:hypothetical protein
LALCPCILWSLLPNPKEAPLNPSMRKPKPAVVTQHQHGLGHQSGFVSQIQTPRLLAYNPFPLCGSCRTQVCILSLSLRAHSNILTMPVCLNVSESMVRLCLSHPKRPEPGPRVLAETVTSFQSFLALLLLAGVPVCCLQKVSTSYDCLLTLTFTKFK